ncbi:MAG: tetratricopeptide repeat protein, partial [Burkholderiaceae bacterium]|nr:tetratricopeptide repeat protein [Burkholderiaceae bacterium]
MTFTVSSDDRHGMALSLLRAGRLKESVSAFNEILRQDPLSVPARMGLAEACLRCDDGWTAAAWLSDACRVAPQDVGVWQELIGLLARQERHSEVAPVLESAAALHPFALRFLEPLAEHHLRCANHARAVDLYRRLAALDARSSSTQLHLGFALENVGELDEAIVHYRQAIALNPDLVEAHVDLAGVLWRVCDFEGALQHAQRAVALAPDSAYAQRILGTALLHLNRLAQSEAQLRHAIELRPDLFMARFDLALLLLLAGRLEEGWAAYARRWDEAGALPRPDFYQAEREWQGPVLQALEGRRILVYAEQGMGDV